MVVSVAACVYHALDVAHIQGLFLFVMLARYTGSGWYRGVCRFRWMICWGMGEGYVKALEKGNRPFQASVS